jgi:hypothetical protein
MLSDDGTRLRTAADRLLRVLRPRFDRLWAYYRNPMRVESTVVGDTAPQRPYRQAQEWGLPARITGVVAGENVFDGTVQPNVARKEVVVENDIGWRIETQTDFLFGRPIVLNSASPDPSRRDLIEQLLRQTLANNGGLIFLQKLALLGAVYGQVDVLVKFKPDAAALADASDTQSLGARTDPPPSVPGLPPAGPAPDADATPADANGDVIEPDPGAREAHSPETISRLARMVVFEIVDPTRALPLLEPEDVRTVHAFATVYQLDRADAPATKRPQKWWQSPFAKSTLPLDRTKKTIVELITPTAWQKYDDFHLIASGPNTLGRLPLVHVQNVPDPLGYDGISDVEPLIPLQDELNTRLSDRAYRIALQSFKMYLGKGIDNFADLPVTPGRMWSSDNPEADVIAFGGDAGCPSEESHIAEVREAIDKLSGVSPVAAGAIRGKIGNLTSAEALRVTMLALLSRTERRRSAYGTAIAQLCELTLAWLDHSGLFRTTDADRAVQIHWPNPMPSNETDRLELAKLKQQVGIPRDVVLRELGYGDSDAAAFTSLSRVPKGESRRSDTLP